MILETVPGDVSLLSEMIRQSPIAAAIIFTAILFLRTMDRRDKEFAVRQEQMFAAWKESVQANTTVLGQVIEQVHRGDLERERSRKEDRDYGDSQRDRDRIADRKERKDERKAKD